MTEHWTAGAIAILKREFAAGAPYRLIVETLNTEDGARHYSKDSIRRKCAKLGLRRRERRQWSAANEKKVIRLIEDGLSASMIAKQMGCTRNMVIGKARRLGLQLQGAAQAGRLKPAPALKPKPPKLKPVSGITRGKPRPPRHIVQAPPMRKEGHPYYSAGGVWAPAPPRGLCQYPEGLLPGPTSFCGDPVHELSSYCLYHHTLCYRLYDDLKKERKAA